METRTLEATNASTSKATRAILTIALAQLLGTSLWFSANGAMHELQRAWGLGAFDIGILTNAVQIGFILGTLISALTGMADKYSAAKLFCYCAVAGAVFNGLFALFSGGIVSAVILRLGVGFALAGIYPLGMKLLVTWAPGRAAESLALLVAMLTLGTSSTHALRAYLPNLDYQLLVLASSALALVASVMIWLLGEGPHARRKLSATIELGTVLGVFRIPEFRAAALGYFGHMWELYAFWTLTPLLVLNALKGASDAPERVALWSFVVIGVGAIGCVVGGRLSRYVGSGYTAFIALGLSGAMCLLYPFVSQLSTEVQLTVLLIWGIAVVADSPQFSALSVQACPPDQVGGALTIQNSLGFFISACAIFATTGLYELMATNISWLLLPGPVLGLLAMRPLLSQKPG
ncbi:TPA: MFS transporter [Pseudomonas aeruginosa]|nr:MFS transporter [Pseudomonas aeruginosa]MBG5781712.1 MFS transporter [Pseudomonas aeruginosa]